MNYEYWTLNNKNWILNIEKITLNIESLQDPNIFKFKGIAQSNEKLDGVGPVDNRPSTN